MLRFGGTSCISLTPGYAESSLIPLRRLFPNKTAAPGFARDPKFEINTMIPAKSRLA